MKLKIEIGNKTYEAPKPTLRTLHDSLLFAKYQQEHADELSDSENYDAQIEQLEKIADYIVSIFRNEEVTRESVLDNVGDIQGMIEDITKFIQFHNNKGPKSNFKKK